MKNAILILAVSLLALISCKKTDLDWQHDYFSFLTNAMNVSVNKDTDSFILNGKITKVSKDRERLANIIIDKERTTAVNGIHYEFSDAFMLFPAKSTHSELKIKLIPENITESMKLVFYQGVYDPEKDMSKHIDTITVNLIPVMK